MIDSHMIQVLVYQSIYYLIKKIAVNSMILFTFLLYLSCIRLKYRINSFLATFSILASALPAAERS